MTPKKHDKAKYTRFLYLAVLPAILIALAGVYFVGEYGLPFGSQFGNNQRQAEAIHAQKKWAERIELPGLPNFHKVSDDLYRGAQPTTEGMKQLDKLGVKTVINLRSMHSDRSEMKGTALSYEHINMTTWNVEDKDVIRFLQIVTDPNRTPVACKHTQLARPGDGGVQQVALQHGVVLGHDRHDHHRKFRAL